MKPLMLLLSFALADTGDAVVLIQSHGGSGTVIATGENWSYILTVAHCFEGQPKPVKLLVPKPTKGNPPQNVGIQIIGIDRTLDLALLKLNAGPLPYVSPVAPPGYRPNPNCLSVGYDGGQVRVRLPATIIESGGNRVWTRESPWLGRSGGALLDGEFLVGVVRAYTNLPSDTGKREVPRNEVINNPARKGQYVSHTAIVSFLNKYGSFGQGGQTPLPIRTDPFVPQNQAPRPPVVYEQPQYRPPIVMGQPQRPPMVYGFQQPYCPPGGS
jgi:hypothetical protein